MTAKRPGKLSAGIAVVRSEGEANQILLVHPGGPFWKNKDEHGWSIPKGEHEDDIDDDLILATARREFTEETGHPVPNGELIALPEMRLGSAKRLRAFVVAGDLDADHIVSNTFEMEWPPRSGTMATFPEVDRAAWFGLDEARTKLHKGQVGLVDLVVEKLSELVGDESHEQK